MQKKTVILLATYNGEKFLREQLDSLFRQSYSDWKLYIHDDGSTDRSVDILSEYQAKHNNITILNYPSTGSSKNNFLKMLEVVDSDYYFFCDQDDVWEQNKIEVELKAIQQAENDKGSDVPIVVCSNLRVVDSNLNTIDESFWHYAGMYPQFVNNFLEMAETNIATGCTMCFNKAAKNVTELQPHDYVLMHDSWVLLSVLSHNGVVIKIDTPLINYRQHSNNVYGAQNADKITLAYKLKNIKESITANKKYYTMLKALGYPSLLTYLKYKFIYKWRVRKFKKAING